MFLKLCSSTIVRMESMEHCPISQTLFINHCPISQTLFYLNIFKNRIYGIYVHQPLSESMFINHYPNLCSSTKKSMGKKIYGKSMENRKGKIEKNRKGEKRTSFF
ncbi:unnamed protein product [Camellia sinensis]